MKTPPHFWNWGFGWVRAAGVEALTAPGDGKLAFTEKAGLRGAVTRGSGSPTQPETW